ncbi:ABC transporter permease [Naumannella cuiyingiana]|uniref:Oligopeptide transport system permease protein n=1 Tax=Naumannella cuiyingiana TaxID=1347891 RepID=A0A7Z0ILU7_9ACTN|nr:ABC transporter permease [Naumannella cuiyingiana]NYI71931.1 oligopeptide transport system permease protein [Naumannella cuiyingiana]
MLTYIARRLLQLIPVFLGTTFLIYAMVYGIGDPTVGRCGERPCPPSYIARLVEEYHLDQPLIVQYGYYLGDLFRGDLGTTFNGQDVGEQLLVRWPTTIKLALIALVFEAVIGILAGVLAGVFRKSFIDYLVTVSSLVVISIPIFVLGGLAQLVLGIQLNQWLSERLGRPIEIFTATAGDSSLRSLLLPGLVLGSVSVAYIARLMRASLAENLRADYVRTARAKGLSNARTIGVHTMRNSMIPVVTYIGTDVGSLMGGAVVTERIFNVNGIGGYLFRSIATKQGTAVVGTITLLVAVYLLANLFVDVLYGYLDPRISHD